MLWQNIALGITGVFTLENIAFMILGVVVGIIFGALPGFSATMGVAVFVPFSYVLEPGAAMSQLKSWVTATMQRICPMSLMEPYKHCNNFFRVSSL